MSDRTIVPFVGAQVPSFVKDEGNDTFQIFLEEYYRWREEEGNTNAVFNDLGNVLDTDLAVERFFEELRAEYMPCIPNNVKADKATLVKNIREFYRSKGSIKSIECLFRILFDSSVEVITDIPPSQTYNIRAQGTGADFPDRILNRTITGSYSHIVIQAPGPSFTTGEIVQQTTPQGVAEGEVFFENDFLLRVTDTNGTPFISGATITGLTSGATRTVTYADNASFIGVVADVKGLGVSNPDVYDIKMRNVILDESTTVDSVTALIPGMKATVLDVTSTEVEMYLSGLVSSFSIDAPGTNYSPGQELVISIPRDGFDFAGAVKAVNSNSVTLPGTWSTNSDPSTLIYTPANTERLDQYFFPGNFINVDGTRYEVGNVSYNTSSLEIIGALSGSEDLQFVSKSFNNDTREIIDIEITNPGYGYSLPPILDFSGFGGGDADVSLSITGAYNSTIPNDPAIEYGYILRSSVPFGSYEQAVRKNVHPAGFNLRGDFLSVTEPTPETNLEMYNLYDPDRENTLDPNNVLYRLFWIFTIGIRTQYLSPIENKYDDKLVSEIDGLATGQFGHKDLSVSVVDYDIDAFTTTETITSEETAYSGAGIAEGDITTVTESP